MEWAPACHPECAGECADRFLAAEGDQPLLFHVWGHAFEFDKFKGREQFGRFRERIAGHSDMLYLTNAETMDVLTGTVRPDEWQLHA